MAPALLLGWVMMKRSLLPAFLVLVLAPAAMADEPVKKVALLPPTGVNVHPAILETAADILKDHLNETGRFGVTRIPGEPGQSELEATEAAAKAKEVGAEIAVVLRITRLNKTARVRMGAIRVSDGQPVYWGTLNADGGPDDLDPVLARLAKGMAVGKPPRDTADLETVTEADSNELKKREASKTFGFHIASLFALDRAGGDAGAIPGFGISWMYDARSWLADLSLDLYHSSHDSGYTAGVGMYYPFSRGDVSFYAGGAARWAYAQFGGKGEAGLMLQPAGGLLIGRLSSVQIRAELGYFVNAFREESKDGVDPTTKTISHGPSLLVGIGF